MHHERTPSLMFDGKGRFRCFGCGAYGSSIDFTAALFSITPKEAVKKLAADFGVWDDGQQRKEYAKSEKPPEEYIVEAWRAVCEVRHRISEEMISLEGEGWDSAEFIEALALRADCDIWLDRLEDRDAPESALELAKLIIVAYRKKCAGCEKGMDEWRA